MTSEQITRLLLNQEIENLKWLTDKQEYRKASRSETDRQRAIETTLRRIAELSKR